MTHHKNKAEMRLYQTREQKDLRPFRQLLNAPPHLHPRNRAFSNLDIYGKLARLELRCQELAANAAADRLRMQTAHATTITVMANGLVRSMEYMATSAHLDAASLCNVSTTLQQVCQ